jgi:hypothetical protein
MFRLLDSIYIPIRDWFGRKAYQRGYDHGHRIGQRQMKGAIMTDLQNKSPFDFKSPELKLGYIYAEGVAKDAKL